MSEIRELLKSRTYNNLTPANYQDAAGVNFTDTTTKSNLEDGGKIASAWQLIHAPTFGAPIPGRIKVTSQVSTAASTKIAQPAEGSQQVNSLIAVEATNAGGSDPVVYNLELTDGSTSVMVVQAQAVLPGATTKAELTLPIVWDYETYLTSVVTGGAYADLTVQIAYYSPVQ